jgi:hypothetical protein
VKSLKELDTLVREHGVRYSEQELSKAIEGKGSIKCSLTPNWSLKKDQTCSRSGWCVLRGSNQNLKCPLNLVEAAIKLRKKHWVEEVIGFI